MDLRHAHDVAVTTAREAGALLRRGVETQKSLSRKSSAVDLVTEYDHRAEALISERLGATFPTHRFVAEEGSQNGLAVKAGQDGYCWYIDPLDGTNNYAHGFPVFAVSLALYRQEKPLIGVIFDPMRDECFSAINGRGARLSANGATSNLQVSQNSTLLESLLATGFPYDRHHTNQDNIAQFTGFLKTARGIRRAGSAALDLAYVAAGRLDGFWEFKLNSWDVAAGVLLVKEAGGHVTGIDGRSWRLSPKVSMVASNGRIHPAMLAVLARVATQEQS